MNAMTFAEKAAERSRIREENKRARDEFAARMQKSIETMHATLAPQREGYRNAILAHLRSGVDALLRGLADAGWDAEKFAPFPHGNMSRIQYVMAKQKYEEVRRWTKTTLKWGCRSPKDPDPREPLPREVIEQRLLAQAEEMTKSDFDSYVAKLSGKIGEPIRSAKLVGHLWQSSVLEVVLAESGKVQKWSTQMILNVSCLGKLFNQWPTRLTK